MESDWQLWVTLAIVAVVALTLCRRMLAFVAGRGGSCCEDCPAKPAGTSPGEDRVIEEREIGLLYKDRTG